MTRLIAAILFALTLSAAATQTVVFTYNAQTGAVQQTGNLVAGGSPTLVFRQADGAWSSTAAYTLVVKATGTYDSVPFILASGGAFVVAGADLGIQVDLNTAELYAYLGRAASRTVMIELADQTATYLVRQQVIVHNSVRRPADSTPAAPALNTYTDAQVDAMIAGIPAGVSPVANPIDGWTVQSDAAGQIEIGPIPAIHMLQLITEYPETTALATGDYILLYDASESALRKVSLNTLLAWLQAQLGL